ncbi:MAG: suppressor of fused domain protein [Lachnospiraceae bacterium]|nr:suppressor of fused domain protein [Lachnospiraceae bacterium]
MDNKKIAKYALSFIGGTPEVIGYLNEDGTKNIDIMICSNGYIPDNVVYSTVGLADTNIGKISENKALRTEIIILGTEDERFADIISSIAFVIQDLEDCGHGMVINNVVSTYIENTELQHVILLHPVFWDRYNPLETENEIAAWLMAVPVTEAERQYIRANSIEDFEELLEKNNVDISDLYRVSCIDK